MRAVMRGKVRRLLKMAKKTADPAAVQPFFYIIMNDFAVFENIKFIIS